MNQPNKIMSLPAGAMFEVDCNMVDEGKMVKELNEALKRATRDILAYWKRTGNTKAAAKIDLKISLNAVPDTTGFMNIRHKIDVKLPAVENASVAMIRGDKLLCRPVGTNREPEQLVMYDQMGRPIGKVDPTTGEGNIIVQDQIGGGSVPVQ